MFDPKKDLEILRELCKDSRKSYREIARKLGIATSTVIHRVNEMKKSGVIKEFTLSLDHDKLGYSLTALVEVTISLNKMTEVINRISKLPNVYGVYNVTGETDAIVLARFKTRQELDNFIKSELATEHVERTNTRLVLNTLKEEYNIV